MRTQTRTLLILAACGVLAGCGSNSPSGGDGGNSHVGDGGSGGGGGGKDGGGGGGGGGCKFSTTGAVTVSGDCDIGPVDYGADKVLQLQFAPGNDVNSTCGTFSAEIAMSPLSATTYSYTTAISASAVCMTDLNSTWQMQKSSPPNAMDRGDFTLVISDPGPMESDSLGGTQWGTPHGTLSITMPGAMGTVTLQATF